MGSLVSASYWQSNAGIEEETFKPNKAGKKRQTALRTATWYRENWQVGRRS
jgi:hypothetical protein